MSEKPVYPDVCPACGTNLQDCGVNVAIEDYHVASPAEGELGDCKFTQCGSTKRVWCDCGHYFYIEAPDGVDMDAARKAEADLTKAWDDFINTDTLELDALGDSIQEVLGHLGRFLNIFTADEPEQPA